MSSRPVTLSDLFLQHGLYLRNWSRRTVRTYRQGLNSLAKVVGEGVPVKAQLESWVMEMREHGLTPGGCNMYIRTINSYLSWLHEQGHLNERLRMKLLKAPTHVLTLLSPQDIKALLTFRPSSATTRRTWTLILLLLDTGIRIDEALGIERERVRLDDLLLIVMGKGAKERMVPFSREIRQRLFRLLSVERSQRPEGRLLFATRTGRRLSYRNAYRDIQTLCRRVGIRTRVHPHLLRHCFAAYYMQRGGEIYRLSRILGHTSVSTTQIYLRSMGIEQLRDDHDTLTPLAG
jgi:integrase/recombinase XerD